MTDNVSREAGENNLNQPPVPGSAHSDSQSPQLPQSPLPPQRKNKLLILAGIIVGIFILLTVSFFALNAYIRQQELSGGQKACTLEAKICPDGSSVGRSGPKCEFSPCPTSAPDPTANWKTYTDAQHGYSFKYPAEWYSPFRVREPVIGGGGAASGIYIEVLPNSLKLSAVEFAQKEMDEANQGYNPPAVKMLPLPLYFTGQDAAVTDGHPGAGIQVLRGYIAKDSSIYRIVFEAMEEKTANQILSTFKFTEKPTSQNTCGDNVCQSVTCMAIGCPQPETKASCPEDCSAE